MDDEHRNGIDWAAIINDFQDLPIEQGGRKLKGGVITPDDLQVLIDALDTVGEKRSSPQIVKTIDSGQEMDLLLKAFGKGVSVLLESSPESPADHKKQEWFTLQTLIHVYATSDQVARIILISPLGNSGSIDVKAGSSAVIGGIFTHSRVDSTKKFPFLGDLPVLGTIFRSQSKAILRMESIIFITPKIISSSS